MKEGEGGKYVGMGQAPKLTDPLRARAVVRCQQGQHCILQGNEVVSSSCAFVGLRPHGVTKVMLTGAGSGKQSKGPGQQC